VFSIGALAGWYFWPQAETVDPGNGGKVVAENSKEKEPPDDTDPVPVDDPTTDVEPENGQGTTGENPEQPDVQGILAEAGRLIEERKYDEAIDKLDVELSGVVLSPQERFEAFLLSGTGYLEKELYEEAIADLTEAIRHNPDPNDVRVYSRRGLAYFHEKRWDLAISDFTTALDIAPNEVDYINRGKAYDGKEDLDSLEKAIDDFTNAIRENRASTQALFSRGLSYLAKSINPKTDDLTRKDDLVRAMNDFEEVKQLDPNYPDLEDAMADARRFMTEP
jgi:tetratricopeptide (TPR) repeat protein